MIDMTMVDGGNLISAELEEEEEGINIFKAVMKKCKIQMGTIYEPIT